MLFLEYTHIWRSGKQFACINTCSPKQKRFNDEVRSKHQHPAQTHELKQQPSHRRTSTPHVTRVRKNLWLIAIYIYIYIYIYHTTIILKISQAYMHYWDHLGIKSNGTYPGVVAMTPHWCTFVTKWPNDDKIILSLHMHGQCCSRHTWSVLFSWHHMCNTNTSPLFSVKACTFGKKSMFLGLVCPDCKQNLQATSHRGQHYVYRDICASNMHAWIHINIQRGYSHTGHT